MRRLAVTALASVLLATFAAASPAAADVSCTGTIGATSIDDTVRVPAGASCTLQGTFVDGNVLVGPGARLTTDGATIDGNVQDDDNGAGTVTLRDTTVGGNVQLFQGGAATIVRSVVDGDVQFESNRGAFRLDATRVGGNVQVNQNSGGASITGNTIDGNLQCQSNTTAPTGGDNVVRGSAEDQCANLRGGGTGGGGNPGGFVDVPRDSVHAPGISWLAESGITGGCTSDGTRFCPNRDVTRGQMATFLDRGLRLPDGSVAAFRDVTSSHPHATGIGAISRAGITGGCTTDGRNYCPSRSVTRGQMATFLDRALDLPAGDHARFRDVPAGHPHAAGIGALARAGITGGCTTDGRSYCPDRPVTRAQMATFLRAALS